ncbi:hypothetical protein FG386_001128 [Cryptosporidium ryanae]|uniref:uncharacterized protein n=1 Tax=Cryptosporidium ryanae TaxID=515981 RepID=UPI00351A73A2|nr:hypothetical protein FG386_001128 [Cryptosporidium ryanae]
MSEVNDISSFSRNGYPDYVLQIPEVSRIVRIVKYVSYIHLFFGFLRIFISETFWAILESITLGLFGVYIFSKNSPLMHYLLYGLISIFHLGCSTLLFYISFITWREIKINNNTGINSTSNNEFSLQPYITRLKISTFSHLICGLLCIFSAYLINRLTKLIDNFNQLYMNGSSDQENPIIYTSIPVNSNYTRISDNYKLEAFSGTPVRLKDYPKINNVS